MAITQNNVQNVKFLRNGSVFTPSLDLVKTAREIALSAMDGQLNSLADGTAILGRYQETGGNVKTLVGFAYISGDTKTLTVFDVDGAGADVDAKILAAIQALDAEKTSEDGKNVQIKVTEVDGKITAVNITTDNTVNSGDVDTAITTAINALDYSGITTSDAAVVTNVTEADGKIAATSANVGGLKLTDYTKGSSSGSVASTDTINQAMSKLEKQIDAEKDARAAAIEALDLATVSGDGEVIVSVSQDNGQVAATKSAIKDVKLTGYQKTSATGAIAATDDVEDALSKLENQIGKNTVTAKDKSVVVLTTGTTTEVGVNIRSGERVLKLDTDATSGGVYTDINVVKITNDLPAEIKERYELRDSDNVKIGESIDIAKDSHIVSINYITTGEHAQNLEYVYIDASGNTQTTYIDMSSLVIEAEFASGVTATSGMVHGVVDANSEKDSQDTHVAFLTVGADGFKISGIKDEIDRKINALDADVSGNSTHVTVGVAEANGKITGVTVSESNIANADDLASEIAARKAVDGQNGNTYASNTSSPYISGASDLNDADVKLAAALKSLSDATVNEVQVNGVALADTNNAVNVQLSAAAGTGAASTPITVDTDTLTGAITLKLEGLDCGTY